jgi:NADH dehydrogenase
MPLPIVERGVPGPDVVEPELVAPDDAPLVPPLPYELPDCAVAATAVPSATATASAFNCIIAMKSLLVEVKFARSKRDPGASIPSQNALRACAALSASPRFACRRWRDKRCTLVPGPKLLRPPTMSAANESPVADAAAPRPRVVIVGAGFGGIEAAKALRDAPVDVTVVDRENHHCFQPLLYQVATAALSPADVAWPIRHMLAKQRNATVLMAEVRSIDTRAQRVVADGVALGYDYLVVATGAMHAYFGHDDWAGAAPGLKGIDDATLIRRRILLAFERAEIARTQEARAHLMTFVIVGGGPTGVEMAGALAEVARQTLPPDFRDIDPRTARILLVEAGPRILPALPEKLSAYAQRALEGMGVEVLTKSPVTKCDARGVEIEGRRIEAATIVWAAGVAASPVASWIDAPSDRAGRIAVEGDLSVPGLPNVFVVGDAATVPFGPDRRVPGLAAAAKQMGRYVGRVIASRVQGRSTARPFAYDDQGDLATIGWHKAVVNLKHLQLTGVMGWLFWSLVHVYFLIGARSRFVVAFSWAWQYLTFQRGARLITGIANAVPRPHGGGPPGGGA